MKSKLKIFLITTLFIQNTSCVYTEEKFDQGKFVVEIPNFKFYVDYTAFRFSNKVYNDLQELSSLLNRKEYKKAEILEKELLSLNLSNNEKSKLFYHLARYTFNEQSYLKKVEDYFDKSIQFAFWNSEKAYIYIAKASFYMKYKKDPIGAERYYKKALELDYGVDSILALSSFYFNSNRQEEFEIFLNNEIKNSKNNEHKIKLLEKLLSTKKDDIEIEKLSKEILKLNITNYRVNCTLASIYLKQKRYKEAEDLIKQAIAMSFNRNEKEQYYFILANLYTKQEKFDKVEEVYFTLISIYPNDVSYYYYLEELYYIHKRYVDLEKLYKEELKKFSSKEFELYTLLAILSIVKKDLENGKIYFNKSLSLLKKDFPIKTKTQFITNFLTFQKLIGITGDKFLVIKNELLLNYFYKSEAEEFEIYEEDLEDFNFFNELYLPLGKIKKYTLSLSLEGAKKENPKLEDIPPTYEPIKN